MNSGMYAALTGNIAAMQKLDILANNLANVNTTGYKRDRFQFESILGTVNNPTANAAPLTAAPVHSNLIQQTDFSAGGVQQTKNTLDFAIDGSGFFVVETPEGRRYTRQGNFHLDQTGRLVTADGHSVMGGGPITISGGRVDVDGEGKIFVDGGQVGTLDIVDFPKPYQLEKVGSALFAPTNAQAAPQPASTASVVKQGFLENSNVSAVLEMVQLIETARYFDSCSKAVKTYDDMATRAVNELGRV